MSDRTLYAISDQRQPFNLHENEAITHTVNWRNVIGGTISTSAWSSESGLTVASATNDDYTASARLSGSQGRYRVTNKVVDTNGDTHERILDIAIFRNENLGEDDYGD